VLGRGYPRLERSGHIRARASFGAPPVAQENRPDRPARLPQFPVDEDCGHTNFHEALVGGGARLTRDNLCRIMRRGDPVGL